MKFYTSYFGKLGALHKIGIVPICIARGIPKFYGGAVEQSVAPYGWMLKDNVTRDQYVEAYFHQVLARVNPIQFLKRCEEISGGRDVALLCYEKPTDFCHRHLLAEWLENETGVEITEFGMVGEPWKHKNPKVVQNSLFEGL